MKDFDIHDDPEIFMHRQVVLWNLLFFSVFMVFFFLPFAVCMAEEPGKRIGVTIMKNVSVSSENIRLGDIAEIDAPEDMLGKLSNVEFGPSPKAGKSRNIRLSSLKEAIEGALPSSQDISIDGPSVIIVKRASQAVSEEMLKEFFMKRVKEISVGKDAEISEFRVRGKNLFPEGDVEIKSSDDSRGVRMGNVSFPVDVFINGSREGRLTLSGHASKKIRVLCAVRDMPKGSIISKEDMVMVEKDAERGVRSGVISDASLLTGKKLDSPVKMGEPFHEKKLSTPAVLKKGDKVRLVAKSGLLSVETSGEAVSDAFPGEQVKIRNSDTGKLVNARVVDATTVEAVF